MANPFYYADDQKIELVPSTAYIALDIDAKADRETLMSAVDAAEGLMQPDDVDVIEPYGILLAPTNRSMDESTVSASVASMESTPGVRSTYPVFQVPGGEDDEVMILIPQFRVQFKMDADADAIEKLNKKMKVDVLETDDVLPNNYLLRLPDGSKKDTLEVVNQYHESDLVDFAEPDFVMKVHRFAAITPGADVFEVTDDDLMEGDGDIGVLPELADDVSIGPAAPVNDPFFPQQWALSRMRVPTAWGITKGRSSIRIAIVDEGVQTRHPDLSGKIVSPYDAVGNDTNQEPNAWDGHGTACAGIAAAKANNGRGVAGVAPNCGIMPIRIAYTSSPSSPFWITNTTWIARGLMHAATQGADVISNSWGGGGYSATIRRALQHARTNGRGGKGAVVISATGNRNRANGVIYPAKYTESLACGASDQADRRKNPSSPDGENWGSNYGPEVDFVAPGVRIYTTDNVGGGGYSNSDYFSRFNGTSSATPNAAGVAALVLSVDPNLRQWEVRDILRLTARDLSPRGKDNETGHGRIDAARAVQAAARLQHQASLRLEFLGTGQECFMRFRLFRLYNSGLNRVRVNSFVLRSYDPSGRLIDQFEYRPNPGGIMMPGLPGPGGDLRFQNLLLKAHGNRRQYSYRWRANWSYTYWRPSRPSTSPSDAEMMDPMMDPMMHEGAMEEIEQEAELVMDSTEGTTLANVTVEAPTSDGLKPGASEMQDDDHALTLSGGRGVTITIKMD